VAGSYVSFSLQGSLLLLLQLLRQVSWHAVATANSTIGVRR